MATVVNVFGLDKLTDVISFSDRTSPYSSLDEYREEHSIYIVYVDFLRREVL